jgi:hypothetical protein
MSVEFLHQPMPVVLNRSPASAENSGNLLVGLARKDRLQNLRLTSCQRFAPSTPLRMVSLSNHNGDSAGKGLFQ